MEMDGIMIITTPAIIRVMDHTIQHTDTDLNGSHIVGARYKQRPHVHIPCVDKGIHCHSANSGFCQRKQDPYDKFQIAAAVKLCRFIQ